MDTCTGKRHSLRWRRILRVGGVLVALVGLDTLIPDLWYPGRRDAFDAVDLEHLLDCAKRANCCYHEPHTIQNEFGSHVEVVDFPRSGMRVFVDVDRDPEGEAAVGRFARNRKPAECPRRSRFHRARRPRARDSGASRVRRRPSGMPAVGDREAGKRSADLRDRTQPGGSVAVLLAAILDGRGYPEVSAVTFGQPKVTDSHGANCWPGKIFSAWCSTTTRFRSCRRFGGRPPPGSVSPFRERDHPAERRAFLFHRSSRSAAPECGGILVEPHPPPPEEPHPRQQLPPGSKGGEGEGKENVSDRRLRGTGT